MNIYHPYFYVICHLASRKYYAGCKFGKDADPSNFMRPNGYTTSSTAINKIIEQEGLESFEVVMLLTEEELGTDVYQFETNFLRENKISSDPNWFNCHDNILAPFGTPEFKTMMGKIHGVEHGMHLRQVKEKIARTNLERYGVSNPLNTTERIQSRILHCIEKYGSANNIEKIKQTNVERYGVENLFQAGEIRIKIEEKIKNKHGGLGNASPTIQAKQKATLQEKYSVGNSFQIPEVVQKTRQATIDRNKDPEYKKLQRERIKESLKSVDRSKENNSFFGKEHSAETKKRISDAKKGRKAPRYCCINCRKEVGINNLTQHTNRCN